MIAADTNVLLRLLNQDDNEQQSALASRWFRRHAADGVYVDAIVLCELAWVMRARYHKHRREIHAVLRGLLDVEGVVVGESSTVRRALARFAERAGGAGGAGGAGDFADYLLHERAAAAGAAIVGTFDRALKREKGFQILG